MRLILLITIIVMAISGCAPEIGSEKWCKKMNEKPKSDWTLNEAKEFTKNCVFK